MEILFKNQKFLNIKFQIVLFVEMGFSYGLSYSFSPFENHTIEKQDIFRYQTFVQYSGHHLVNRPFGYRTTFKYSVTERVW